MARLRIKEIALERGMMQEATAKAANVDRNTNRKYWNNSSPIVSFDVLQRYATLFGVQVTDLIVNDGPVSKGEENRVK